MNSKEIRSIIKKKKDWVYIVDLVKDYGLSVSQIQKALRPKNGKRMLRDGYIMSSNCQRVRYTIENWNYMPEATMPLYGMPNGTRFYRNPKDASKEYDVPEDVIYQFIVTDLIRKGIRFCDMGGYILGKYLELR